MPGTDKIDVLAIGAHPDDVEIFCGGTLCLLVEQGYRVGIVDLSRGELGTRGTPEQRAVEAENAGRIMGVSVRMNLGIPDGAIVDNKENQEKLIIALRTLRPDVVLTGSEDDRHPDHANATALCTSASFFSGLAKVETRSGGDPQQAWRPGHILHYMQNIAFEPDFVVDVSNVWEQRMDAVRAYVSQVHNPEYKEGSDEPETFISDPGFIGFIESRARTLGYRVGASYGEGFMYRHGPIGVTDLVSFLGGRPRL